MAIPDQDKLSKSISWQFTILSQGFEARYGTLNGQFYKQFTPSGNVFPDKYPPKLIDPKLYAIAQAVHKTNTRA